MSHAHSLTASRVKEAEHDVERILESNIGKFFNSKETVEVATVIQRMDIAAIRSLIMG